jgi:RNA recognition motif-containing protein
MSQTALDSLVKAAIMNHTRLYVGDLASTITEQQLHELFEKVGQVIGVHRAPASSFAFVEMASALDAQQAIERYNGYALAGSKLIVYSMPPRSHPRVS